MTKERDKSTRLLPCLIDAFREYSQDLPTPEVFRTWGAIALVAGALERGVYMKLYGKKLYPNQYIALIAPPGIGKSTVISEIHAMWARAGVFNVGPTSLTAAGLLDQVREGMTNSNRGRAELGCPCIIAAPELGTLIPAHDTKFLNILNDLYDCGDKVEWRTRTNGLTGLDYPHIHIIGGTQPKFLGEILPEQAWGMGFTSRLMLIYSSEKIRKSLRETIHKDKKLFQKIVGDLQVIAELRNREVTWDDEAFDALDAWHMTDFEPIPDHSRLQSYIPRRITHLCKIVMAITAAKSNDLRVRLEDFEQAKTLMLDAEVMMPEIFKEMQTDSDAEIINDIFNWMIKKWNASHKPISEHNLTYKIQLQVPTWKIPHIISTMLNAGMIKQAGGLNLNPGQNRQFEPVSMATRKDLL